MNAEVKISELRQNLQHFVARARAGERIGVTVHGEVVAELVPSSDRMAEAKRYLAELRRDMKRRGVEIGDLITPIEYEWSDDSHLYDASPATPRKPRRTSR